MAQKVQKYTETDTYQHSCRGNRAGMTHTILLKGDLLSTLYLMKGLKVESPRSIQDLRPSCLNTKVFVFLNLLSPS